VTRVSMLESRRRIVGKGREAEQDKGTFIESEMKCHVNQPVDIGLRELHHGGSYYKILEDGMA
jgi:hypothetical protein